eukprot:TRINITY_DN1382_c0_g1_i4.p1 TRINITY_DN1382_c0_g1~~TRINITY_DN1382_c0_g1_i4.p1  ORF type:complete len:383 (-),score=83.60 TRINITY_DN1382_c0_g1_i4:43-1191(-)
MTVYYILLTDIVILGPEKMVIVPPRHYVVVNNPVVMQPTENGEKQPLFDENNQVVLKHGDQEIRYSQDPFPLYPGEVLDGNIRAIQLVFPNQALRIEAQRDLVDYSGEKRRAGDQWLFIGPNTYHPVSGEIVLDTVRAIIMDESNGLKLRARYDCLDYEDIERKAGEEWIVRYEGAYLPKVHEEVVEVITPEILEHDLAIHVRASQTFIDEFDQERKAGSEWLVTREDTESFIPNVHETIISRVKINILNSKQYCVIRDPYDPDSGKNLLGTNMLVKGPKSFFLHPGEYLELLDNSIVLTAKQGIELCANEQFVDSLGKTRRPGDKWIVYGPGDYWKPIGAEVLRHINVFLYVEPLGLYFFSPLKVSIALLLIAILFYYVVL